MSDITPDVPTPIDTNVTVICPTVSTRNRFDVLAQDQSTDISSVPLQANRPSYVRRQSAPNAPQPKRPPRRENNTHPVSVTVIGSSIVRGVSPCLQQSKDYNAVGFVYPGMTAKYIIGRLKDIPEASTRVIWTTWLLNPHLVTTFEIRPDFCNLNSIHTHSGINRLDTLAQKFGICSHRI